MGTMVPEGSQSVTADLSVLGMLEMRLEEAHQAFAQLAVDMAALAETLVPIIGAEAATAIHAVPLRSETSPEDEPVSRLAEAALWARAARDKVFDTSAQVRRMQESVREAIC